MCNFKTRAVTQALKQVAGTRWGLWQTQEHSKCWYSWVPFFTEFCSEGRNISTISVPSVWLLSEQFLGILKRVPQVLGHILMTVFIAACAVSHPRSHRRHSSTESFLQKSWAGFVNCPLHLGNRIALWNFVFTSISWASFSRGRFAGCHYCRLSVQGSQCQSWLGLSLADAGTSKSLLGVPGAQLGWAGPVLGCGTAWPGILSIWDWLCTRSAHPDGFWGWIWLNLASHFWSLRSWPGCTWSRRVRSRFCPVCEFLLPLVHVRLWHSQHECFLVCCCVFTKPLHRYQGDHKNSNFYLLCTHKKL